MTMLEFQNVSYQYPSEDFDIIDHLSFAVEPGSFHCIIGISVCTWQERTINSWSSFVWSTPRKEPNWPPPIMSGQA